MRKKLHLYLFVYNLYYNVISNGNYIENNFQNFSENST